ncbi:MAG TPA: hypothetical protein VHA35_00365 [Dongiaceae bacterium]|jgi:hypothetical protein|nr:hypothetical protein [Dongiaceae bacterium]
MRIVLLIFAALILAACQQVGETPSAATDAGSADERHTPLRFFEPEFAALQNQMLLNLADACQARAAEKASFDRCLRERVAMAFDDSGEGRVHCAFHTGFGDFLDCVAMGNTFIDVMRRMTDTAPVPSGFWAGGDAMVRTLSRSIVSKGVANCRTESTAPTLNRCIDHWFEERLSLASSLTQRCPPEDEPRTTCLVEAVMIRFMQDHVPRLSAIGI